MLELAEGAELVDEKQMLMLLKTARDTIEDLLGLDEDMPSYAGSIEEAESVLEQIDRELATA